MSLSDPNQHIRRFTIGTCQGEVWMSDRKWWKSVIAYLYAILVTILCFAVVLEGNGVVYVTGTVIVGMLCIILLFGIDVEYVKLGDFFEIRFKDADEEVVLEYEGPVEPEDSDNG